jgi:hypothetical protein
MGKCIGHMGKWINMKKYRKIHLGHMGKNGGHMATEHFSDIWENMADIWLPPVSKLQFTRGGSKKLLHINCYVLYIKLLGYDFTCVGTTICRLIINN